MARAPITYVSDQAVDYVKAITKARTLAELWHVLDDYRTLFYDAYEQRPINQEGFKVWRKGLAMERRREFAGDAFMERFGALLLPALMLNVGEVALKYGVPWGCAYLRLKDGGLIVERDGVSRWRDKPKEQ